MMGNARIRRTALAGALAVTAVMSGTVSQSAFAAPVKESSQQRATAAKTVDSLQVRSTSPDGLYTSTLTLRFDKPVDAAEAARMTRRLAATRATSTVTPKAAVRQQGRLGPAYISCEGSGNWSDANGTLSMQYTCPSGGGTLAWGYRISPAVQAIIVSNVSERGLRWWRNGTAMPQNAPHVVPDYYTIHGSMRPTYNNNRVEYQDYMTFRHNLGPGGTGNITWAGRVTTLTD